MSTGLKSLKPLVTKKTARFSKKVLNVTRANHDYFNFKRVLTIGRR